MTSTLHLTADIADERVDVFLSRQLPQYSRSYLQKLCEQGLIGSDKGELKPSTKLKVGDILTLLLPELPDFSQQTLPLLYEDDDVLVINKPEGVLTHAKGAMSDEFTVAEFVRPRTTDGVTTNRPGIVHRLDRGTSGIIIAAKHTQAKRWLQKQFTERKVKKMYIALVDGHPDKPTAALNLPIERNPRKPQTFRVGSNGKSAETIYEVAQTFKQHSLLHLRPLTGRTHQLRVHCTYLGHPIVGDTLYGKPSKILERMFLHAAELELTLPSRERKVFQAPLPKELANYLKTLQ
jgi:23S rRNA pseudouridine1911/1915/1917 synthase